MPAWECAAWTTQAIVDASNWIADIRNVIGVFAVIFGTITFHGLMTKYVRPYRCLWHFLLLKLPLFGGIIMMAVVALIAIAGQFAAGVSVLDYLTVASTVTTNMHFMNAFNRVNAML